MKAEFIQQALSTATDTKEFIIGKGALKSLPLLLRETYDSRKAFLIADENTIRVAGEQVLKALNAGGIATVENFIFPSTPMLRPSCDHADKLSELLISTDATPIALGSGTVNDIVKLGSHQAKRRYLAVPTAPSVDGYSSFGASMLYKGYKKTIDCPAPLAIVADTDILKNAPYELIAAGYGDLAGKITAGADWIIADMLGCEPIDKTAWGMVQKRLRSWVGNPDKVALRDQAAVESVFEGLALSGFAMQAIKLSRPASGTEHFFSHIWEMQSLEEQGYHAYHGAKVGFATLPVTAFLEVLFSMDPYAQDATELCRVRQSAEQRAACARQAFTNPIAAEEVAATVKAKHLDDEALLLRINRIRELWPEMKRRVEGQLMPFDTLKHMLSQAGCPITPEQIHITREELKRTFFLAQMIRNRYTGLDLAFELGILDECVDRVFSCGKYF